MVFFLLFYPIGTIKERDRQDALSKKFLYLYNIAMRRGSYKQAR